MKIVRQGKNAEDIKIVESFKRIKDVLGINLTETLRFPTEHFIVHF